MEWIILSITNGVFAYLFSNHLTEPGQVFGFWWKFWDRITGGYVMRIDAKSEWLYFALGGCSKCFAGQLSTWTGIAAVIALEWPVWVLYPYIVGSMFIAFALNWIFE